MKLGAALGSKLGSELRIILGDSLGFILELGPLLGLPLGTEL